MKFSTISEVVCDEELAAGIEAIRAWGGTTRTWTGGEIFLD
jgi:hypothetical protein